MTLPAPPPWPWCPGSLPPALEESVWGLADGLCLPQLSRKAGLPGPLTWRSGCRGRGTTVACAPAKAGQQDQAAGGPRRPQRWDPGSWTLREAQTPDPCIPPGPRRQATLVILMRSWLAQGTCQVPTNRQLAWDPEEGRYGSVGSQSAHDLVGLHACSGTFWCVLLAQVRPALWLCLWGL